MAREVKIDLDILALTKQTYDEGIAELNDIIKSLTDIVEQLRHQAWKSEGADVFYQNYETTWKTAFKDHVAYLEHLRDCLETAQTTFYEVYNSRL